jgi:hypothetical protein
MKMNEQEAYEILLERIRQVFGNELNHLTETQGAILNGLIMDRVEAHKGDFSKVTLDELEGVREMLYTEFTMAAVESDIEGTDIGQAEGEKQPSKQL